jgi:ABC-type lipopolysaccharide export system ATPase subunit
MNPSFIHRTVLEELRRDIHREEIAFLIGPRQAGKNPDHEAILGRGDQVDLEGAPAL